MDEVGAILERILPRGTVLAVDAAALRDRLRAENVVEATAIDDDAGVYDGAVIGALGGAAPLELARSLTPRLRSGAALAFALPTRRGLFGLMKKKRTVVLEELCEALLIAGYEDIQARELAGATIVWGRATASER